MMKEKEDKRVPQLRFPEFTDDWEQRKAKELFVSTADKGYPELPVLSATQDRGMIRRDENSINIFHDKKNEAGYKRVLPGQFVIHLRSFQGGFAHSAIEGITSPAYTVFGFSEPEKHDSEYWKYVFTSKSFIQRLETVTYGIRDGRSISYEEFLTLGFVYPSKAEQTAIARYLDKLSDLITLHQRKLEKLKELKKGLVQKLFSQEVRFKADDGSEFPKWEEKRLSGLFGKVIEKNRLDLPALTIIQGYGTIRRDESERKITYDEKGLKNYKAVQKDDFIVHLRSFEGGLEIANQDGIVSPAYHVYRGNDEVHPLFYYPYFRSSSFIKGKLAVCVTGVRDGKNIEMGAFDELLIPHPCLAEQQKIAECLSALDDVIEKQKATLAAWEELKKGLLQQMFV
ncbi:MAG: restriction endonuclease subunit S [Lachnospiraceae bacterium]